MAVKAAGFFDHIDDFIDYRKDIYLASDQTLKSNRIDLRLFENFIGSKSHKTLESTVWRKQFEDRLISGMIDETLLDCASPISSLLPTIIYGDCKAVILHQDM